MSSRHDVTLLKTFTAAFIFMFLDRSRIVVKRREVRRKYFLLKYNCAFSASILEVLVNTTRASSIELKTCDVSILSSRVYALAR